MLDPLAALIVEDKIAVPVRLISPTVRVPFVVRFSSPNDIVPLELVILPSASVRSPIVEPVAALMVDEKVPVPVTSILPRQVFRWL